MAEVVIIKDQAELEEAVDGGLFDGFLSRDPLEVDGRWISTRGPQVDEWLADEAVRLLERKHRACFFSHRSTPTGRSRKAAGLFEVRALFVKWASVT